MFLSLPLLKWPLQPKFILPIKSLSVLPVGMQTYISPLSSPLMQGGACDTSIQAAAGMHRPYQWCKNASKPCFAKWLCDGHKAWESWDTATQRGSLGKSFFFFLPLWHNWDFQSCGENQETVSSNQGLGSTNFALLWGSGGPTCLCHPSLRHRKVSEWVSPLLASQATETCHREGCFGPGKGSQNACLGAGTRSPAAAMLSSISAAQ